jgi:hypothetical protein
MKYVYFCLIGLSLTLAQLPPGNGPAQPENAPILEPVAVKFQPDLLSRLTLPEGFSVSVFTDEQNPVAQNLKLVHGITAKDGTLYIMQKSLKQITALEVADDCSSTTVVNTIQDANFKG